MADFFTVSLYLENCTANVEENTQYGGIYDIKVFANENYDFLSTIPYIGFSGNYGYNTYEMDKISATEYHIEFDSEYLCDNHVDVSIYANATKSTGIKNKYGLISVYNPTANDLIEISKIRYETFNSYSGGGYIDTAQYLIKLFRIYCNVNTGNPERVFFGKYDMKIDCPIVEDEIITLDCGNVVILEKYHNSVDYNNTDIEIYLPFIGFSSLSTTDFMNNTVNLKYQVNIINGDSLAILSVGENELFLKSCNIAFNIPYTMEDNSKIYSEIDANNNYLNSLQPFIYVKRGIINDANKIKPFNNSAIYDKIGNYSGYAEISDIDFKVINSSITYNEMLEIKQLLSSGVIL